MKPSAAATPCTPHQRLYMRTLMQRAELSTYRFSCMHRVPFKDAGLPEPPLDTDVDTHLRTLSMKDASALIDALKAYCGIEEEDDD